MIAVSKSLWISSKDFTRILEIASWLENLYDVRKNCAKRLGRYELVCRDAIKICDPRRAWERESYNGWMPTTAALKLTAIVMDVIPILLYTIIVVGSHTDFQCQGLRRSPVGSQTYGLQVTHACTRGPRGAVCSPTKVCPGSRARQIPDTSNTHALIREITSKQAEGAVSSRHSARL